MTAGQDVRFALRQMAKRPGFATAAVIVLAIGISSVTAVFAVLYQALLRPLPYPNPQQLFFIQNAFPKSQVTMAGVSGFDYGEIRKLTSVFAQCSIYYYNDLNLTGVGTAQHVDVVNASASIFDVFNLKPAMGRVFTQAEDKKGADGTAILSDAFWRGTFWSRPARSRSRDPSRRNAVYRDRRHAAQLSIPFGRNTALDSRRNARGRIHHRRRPHGKVVAHGGAARTWRQCRKS